jgi:hypothetical protein
LHGWRAPAIAKRAFAPACCRLLWFFARLFRQNETREESGMEKLLGSLNGTIIAGFVLTVVLVLLIHAIH